MSKLDYIPSWLDGAYTLLQKLDKCIEKIEGFNTILETYGSEHNEIKQSVEQLNTKATELLNQITDVLSLAQTNESDIGVLDGQVASIETEVSNLSNEITSLKTIVTGTSGVGGLSGRVATLETSYNYNILPTLTTLNGGGVVHIISGNFTKDNEEFSFTFISRPMTGLNGRIQLTTTNYVNRRNTFSYGFITLSNISRTKVYWGQVISVEVDNILSPSKIERLLINGMSVIDGSIDASLGSPIPFGSEDGQFSRFVDGLVGE